MKRKETGRQLERGKQINIDSFNQYERTPRHVDGAKKERDYLKKIEKKKEKNAGKAARQIQIES